VAPRTLAVSERLQAVYAAEAELREERERLLAEWPEMEGRARGEAFRQVFGSVTLHWDRKFHPASAKPTRPRKTNRPGRYSYALRRDRIEWGVAGLDTARSR
jgi:hypothetical protein